MALDPRSFLFIPGNRDDRFDKALSAGADALIFDLEDAVGAEQKDDAREKLRPFRSAALRAGIPVFVRVNGLGSQWLANDVRVALQYEVDGVVAPKIHRKSDIATIEDMIASVRNAGSVGPELVPLLESPSGILNAREILTASQSIKRVFFGSYDYASSMQIPLSQSQSELDPVRTWIGLCAAESGIQAVDSVTGDLADESNLIDSASRARRMGFSGKLCIHPSQLAPVQRAFSPSEAEILFAQRVTTAWDLAESHDAISVDGKLIDYPIVAQQRHILERAEAFGLSAEAAEVQDN